MKCGGAGLPDYVMYICVYPMVKRVGLHGQTCSQLLQLIGIAEIMVIHPHVGNAGFEIG